LAGGKDSTGSNHALCDSAVGVPAAPPVGKKYQPETAAGKDFDTGSATAGWKCLRFSMTQAIYYRYLYNKGALSGEVPGAPAIPAGESFESAAVGDLDGDGAKSGFALVGGIENGEMRVATQVFVVDESE